MLRDDADLSAMNSLFDVLVTREGRETRQGRAATRLTVGQYVRNKDGKACRVIKTGLFNCYVFDGSRMWRESLNNIALFPAGPLLSPISMPDDLDINEDDETNDVDEDVNAQTFINDDSGQHDD
jgi:hypothetical protein